MSGRSLRVALCFPGQGSQSAGMAAGLDATDAGSRLLAAARAAGADLDPAFAGDEERLRATEVAQPALVFTELALAAALPPGLEVVAFAGHSVGELSALGASGALDPEQALRLAVERGRLMAGMREGTMAAVLGLEADVVARLCAEMEGTVVVANLNAPGQVVVSGAAAAVDALSTRAREAGARRVLPLKVSGAFHSPLMVEAAAEFAQLLATVEMRVPSAPVVANVDALPVTDPVRLREGLGRQMVSPVRWSESVLRMAEMGAQALVEVGPGSVLTGLARRIAPATPALSVDSLEAAASLEERLRAVADG